MAGSSSSQTAPSYPGMKGEEEDEELAGNREDIIDMLGDGWVVKLTDSALLPRYEG